MHAAPQCSYVSLWAPHPSPTEEELCLSPPAPTEQPGRSLLVWGGHGTTSLAPEHFLLLALLLYLLFIVSTCHRCKRINHPKPCFPDSIYSSTPFHSPHLSHHSVPGIWVLLLFELGMEKARKNQGNLERQTSITTKCM